MRVLSVSSGRADIGILTPVWSALGEIEDIELHIFLTGMHMAPGPTPELPSGVSIHRGGADLGGEGAVESTRAMADILAAAGAVYRDVRPDVVLVTGDRLDMVPAALAAVPFNLPMVHLHGGEVTEGALDDSIRHAITKLCHLHCVATEGARDRLIALGEEPRRITVTGAPGLDTLLVAPEMAWIDFAKAAGLDSAGDHPTDLCLVTVHPETNAHDPLAPLEAVLAALDAWHGLILITGPNSDPGGSALRRRIRNFAETRPRVRFVETLGSGLYANALRHARVMIGNSSSGLIEAGLFGLPVIDVGTRQTGRECGENVHKVPADSEPIVALLENWQKEAPRFPPYTPYGHGHAGPEVVAVIAGALQFDDVLAKPDPIVASSRRDHRADHCQDRAESPTT